MAEIRLANLRIGFPYAADLNFPPAFLEVGESVRAKLRRYPGAAPAAVFTDQRVGNTVTLSLTAEDTADLEPGSYISEAVIYTVAAPGDDEIPLADNTYVLEADFSPSE